MRRGNTSNSEYFEKKILFWHQWCRRGEEKEEERTREGRKCSLFDVRPAMYIWCSAMYNWCTFLQLMFSHVRTSAMFRNSICDSEGSECRANCGGFESCEAENKQWRKGKRRNGHQTILCNTRWMILYYTIIPYDTVQYNTITGNQAENKHFSEGKGGMGDMHIEMEAMWEIWGVEDSRMQIRDLSQWGLKGADKRYVPSRKGES